MGTRGTNTSSCPASTSSSTIGKVISKLSQSNQSVKQLIFGDGTNDLNNLIFQTQSQQSPMADTPIEQGDEQEQDPLDGQQHTDPTGNQTLSHAGQIDGQNTRPSGQAPRSSAAGQESQSPAERAAAARNQGRTQSEDQFPMPPPRTGTPRAPTQGPLGESVQPRCRGNPPIGSLSNNCSPG